MSCKDYAGFASFLGVLFGIVVAGVLVLLFLRGLTFIFSDREDVHAAGP